MLVQASALVLAIGAGIGAGMASALASALATALAFVQKICFAAKRRIAVLIHPLL